MVRRFIRGFTLGQVVVMIASLVVLGAGLVIIPPARRLAKEVIAAHEHMTLLDEVEEYAQQRRQELE